MFKTWALILMVSTSNGEIPQDKARFESLDACTLYAVMAFGNQHTWYCYHTTSGQMYNGKDYLHREYNKCLRMGVCKRQSEPKENVKAKPTPRWEPKKDKAGFSFIE